MPHRFKAKTEINQPLQFVRTAQYPCVYLSNRQASSVVATPFESISPLHYERLIQQGFRRSGEIIYQPVCKTCQACISVRVDINRYTFSKNQKRLLKKFNGWQIKAKPLHWEEEHFQLYLDYQTVRHRENLSLKEQQKNYQNIVIKSSINSFLIEFRDPKQQLKMVSICDQLINGLSAVYTFYDIQDPRSLGTLGVLNQIHWCKTLNYPWLYLGYWVKNNQKMNYKLRFQPLEYFYQGHWQKNPPLED